MTAFVFVLCYRTSLGEPAFVHKSIDADSPDAAETIGAKWSKQVIENQPGREGINTYLLDVADLVDESDDSLSILHQFCDDCGRRDRGGRCGDDS